MQNLLPRYDALPMEGRFNTLNNPREIDREDQKSGELSPLWLDMEDEELIQIVDEWVDDYKSFYASADYNLFERRKKNEIALFGRQIIQKEKEKLLKDYESKYAVNVLYEIEGTIKPLGMARLPDLMVVPGNDTDQSVLMAQEVSKAIDTEIKERENRFTLGLAFKHLPTYFTGVIKVRWDPEIDDYVYECIHPDLIEVDHNSAIKNADKMKFVSHILPLTVQEVTLRFPKSKEKFYDQLKADGMGITEEGNATWTALATIVQVREVWFTEYKRHADNEVERIDGVLWKYKDVILAKMKNPNFDYEGETRYFAYDEPGNEATKRGLNAPELQQILMSGEIPSHVKEEQVYHNYFKNPRKPFYFMGYDQWGKQPYDETSRIEQNLQSQESINKRGKQIEETLANRGHDIFSKGAMTPAEVEEFDPEAPSYALSVDGDVDKVHAFIAPERPTAQEFEQLNNLRDSMYAIAHSNAVRGEIQHNTPATNTQIGRESDFTAADDLVEDTINDAAQWMADWAMQFIKLRYTKDHFRWIMGVAGDAVYMKLNRNMIGDGMIVRIKASGTDKLRAQNNAMEMAKMEMTDPYTFFVDMGLSDPEGRTERLILAKTDPISYLQKVVKGLNTSEALAKALMNAEQTQSPTLPQQPSPTMPGSGQPANQPQQPAQPSPANTAQAPVQPPAQAPAGSPRNL